MTETVLTQAVQSYRAIAADWRLPDMAPINLSLAPLRWTASAAARATIEERLDKSWCGWVLMQSSGPRLLGPEWPQLLPTDEELLRAELAAPSGVESIAVTLVCGGDWRGAVLRDDMVGTPTLFDDVERVVDAAVALRATDGGRRPRLMRYRRYWSATASDPVIRPRHVRLLEFAFDRTE